MSLLLYSKIPGTQVKRDANLSNATIQCDPSALYPLGATQGGVLLNKENLAGKIAVEHDLCNLDVNNLTVNGVLVAKGPAEICNIVCPADFTVTAGINIIETAAGNMNLTATAGTITGAAGGAISLTSTDSTEIISTGTGAGQGSINLISSANSSGTGGQIVLNANASANLFGTAGVQILGNNIRSTTATGNQSGGSLNVFPQVAGAKGLHVVCRDTVLGEYGIAADLTGTTILRSDDPGFGPGIGATGHLCFAPSSASGSTNIDPTINVDGGTVTVGLMLANSADACGRFELTLVVNGGVPGTATLRFAKPYPTAVTNVFISPVNADASNAILDGYFVDGTDTDFTLRFPNGITNAGEALFDYFVVDVLDEGQQIG